MVDGNGVLEVVRVGEASREDDGCGDVLTECDLEVDEVEDAAAVGEAEEVRCGWSLESD